MSDKAQPEALVALPVSLVQGLASFLARQETVQLYGRLVAAVQQPQAATPSEEARE